METPAAAPRAPAPGTVPLPIGDVLRIANEYERGGRLDEAKRLLDRILAAAPNQGDALHLSGIVAFRQGEIATVARPDGTIDQARHRYAAVSSQHLRGVPRDGAPRRGAGRRASRHRSGAGRSAVPAQPGDHPLSPAGTGRVPRLRRTARCASTPACQARISCAPRRCCCAANGARAGTSTNGASASPAPRH